MPDFRAAALLGALLLSACETTPVTETATLRFVGTWKCDLTTMIFTPTDYSAAPGDKPMPIRQIETQGDETKISFDDSYQITVRMNGDNQMSWLSAATGDGQQCTRIAGAT